MHDTHRNVRRGFLPQQQQEEQLQLPKEKNVFRCNEFDCSGGQSKQFKTLGNDLQQNEFGETKTFIWI